MLFEFELLPLEDLEPWYVTEQGSADCHRFHWFALSDGFFRIRVGSDHLFESSEEIIRHRSKNNCSLHPKYGAWTDYQISHHWSYLLDSLPTILQPLPEALSEILKFDLAGEEKWYAYIKEQLSDKNDRYAASGWMYGRGLETMFLGAGRPFINTWSSGDQVYIKWEAHTLPDGIPRWSSMKGLYQMPVTTFVGEVHSFHNRLMSAMQRRIEAAQKMDWKSKFITFDFKNLDKEQAENSLKLSEVLNKKLSVAEIDEAMKLLSIIQSGFLLLK